MVSNLDCPEWALSHISVATLVRLDLLGIPFPTSSPFRPYSVLNTAGNKLVVGDGFPSCTWQWTPAVMGRNQWARLAEFLGGASSAFVYLRTTNNNQRSFANYYGVMALPPLVPVGFNVRAFETPALVFSALVAQ